jgi:hypothetical protein
MDENENIQNQDQPEIKMEDILRELQSLKSENQKLKSDNEKSNKAKQDLLNEVKTKKEILKNFELKAEDEFEQELIKKGDLDSLKNMYKQKISKDYESTLNEKDNLLKQYETERNELQNKLFKKNFDIQVTGVLSQVKDLQEGATESLKILIERDSKLDENGNLVFLDQNGNVRTIVKNNQLVNLELSDYVGELRKKQPFFFKPAQGNDTKSTKQNHQGKTLMTKKEYDNKIQELQGSGKFAEASAIFKAKQNGVIVVE